MNTIATAVVRYEVRADVAFITLDHPPVNVLSAALMEELASTVETLPVAAVERPRARRRG